MCDVYINIYIYICNIYIYILGVMIHSECPNVRCTSGDKEEFVMQVFFPSKKRSFSPSLNAFASKYSSRLV